MVTEVSDSHLKERVKDLEEELEELKAKLQADKHLLREIDKLRTEIKEKDDLIQNLEIEVEELKETVGEQRELLKKFMHEVKMPEPEEMELPVLKYPFPYLHSNGSNDNGPHGLKFYVPLSSELPQVPPRLLIDDDTPIAKIWEEVNVQMKILNAGLQEALVQQATPKDAFPELISTAIHAIRNNLMVIMIHHVMNSYTKELKKANAVQEEVKSMQNDVIQRLELLKRLTKVEVQFGFLSKKSKTIKKKYERLVKDFQNWLMELEELFDLEVATPPDESESETDNSDEDKSKLNKLKIDMQYWKRRLRRCF